MRAVQLLKHNIDTLLKARNQTRRDLAQWVRQSMDHRKIDPWISHIFNTPDAEFQMKYLDRIADFFGVTVYQLFQPGISHLTERRKVDRRSGKDRRLSALNHQVRESVSSVVANLKPVDVADLIRLRGLSEESRATLRDEAQRLERSERETSGRGKGRRGAGRAGDTATTPKVRPLKPRGQSDESSP